MSKCICTAYCGQYLQHGHCKGYPSDGHETSPSELHRLATKLEQRSGVIGDGRAEAAIHMRRAAAMLTDTARLDWLIQQSRLCNNDWSGWWEITLTAWQELKRGTFKHADIRSAIDAEMAASKPPVQPTGGANG